MIPLARLTDDFLRGKRDFAVEAPFSGRIRGLVALVVAGGLLYGAVMGTYSGIGFGKPLQIVYSALKVPILLLVTFLLCLPSFYVLNLVAGLHEDFGRALRAVIATQACIAVVLAGLAPLTAFYYVLDPNYGNAVLVNGVMFAIAAFSSQIVMRRYYDPLIEGAPRHRHMKRGWLVLYIFVGIQMGWVLRPYIGSPGMEVSFFRKEAWGNAYVVVVNLVGRALAP